MGSRGPTGPLGKNGDDVSDLLIMSLPGCSVLFLYNRRKDI